MVQLADPGTLIDIVDEHGGTNQELEVDLLFVFVVGADGGNERPG
jgi:hypothetical protein